MTFGTVSSKALVVAAAIGLSFACGGGDGGDENDGQLADANRQTSSGTGGGTGSVKLPEVCQRQAECPTGYVCVPPADSFQPALDQTCYSHCSPTCTNAGSFAEACDQDCKTSCTSQTPPPDGELNGKCLADGDRPGDDPDDDGSNGSGGSGGSSSDGPTIQWANTWTADVEYTANCDWANTAKQSGSQKFTVTMKVSGSNSTPTATVSGGYELEGTGGDDRMTLTGDFPMRNWKGETATTHSLNSPNEVTIKMTTVESATKATGTIEGNWDASAGWKCTAADGKITLSR
ncbi:MAG TPA: hypothetical protein VFS67_08420 [Polyangiaceae bacterium]|jgi:hypothetical protein|nr:hypothetical protein [Polyangiaceae bacterium]